MNVLLLAGLALAGGLHTGVPVHGVSGLGPADFEGPAIGWSAAADGGFVRVFVGHDEGDAGAWLGRQRESFTVAPPDYPGFADEAWGDGDGLLGFRDGNVGVVARVGADARGLAALLQAAIVDGDQGWPAAATLRAQGDGTWAVTAPGAAHVSFEGGRLVAGSDLVFQEPPRVVTVWDAWGRATEVTFPSR